MAFQKHTLSSLIDVDPKTAAEKLLAAYTEARANQRNAAKKLGVSEGTIIRWIKRLNLGQRFAKVKARALREGWHHDENKRGGRPVVA